MKTKLATFLISIFLIANAKATIRTVNNAGAAQYADLDAAYGAAVTNDTLLLSGSAIVYFTTNTSWAKNLVVIGTGLNSNKQNFQEAKLGLTGNGAFYISSTCKFMGVRFKNIVNLSATLNGLEFEDCKFDLDFFGNGYAYSNVKFINCIFISTGKDFTCTNSNVSSVLFSHCIFNGYFTGSNNNLPFGVTVDHCIFLRDNGCFINVYSIIISNSIFYGTTPLNDVSNSTFNNNISRVLVSGAWSINGNTSINNTDGINPNFVNVPIGTVYTNSMDFHINAPSQALGNATDGSDIGIHDAGATFNEAGEPQNIPVIRNMILTNTSLPQSGNVNVKVRSTKAR